MCSIVGFVDWRGRTPHDVIDMLAQTRHRGPDALGVYADGSIEHSFGALKGTQLPDTATIGLGHARLEIVGGEAGLQPLTGCDDRLSLVHNGEIYNYRELRELLAADHQFASGSDSEVLLHLVEELYLGDLGDAVKQTMAHLDGMYAFAVTDGRSVVLARDPVGKKPVYYVDGFPFYFASEPKALAWTGRSIERLLPGQILVATADGITIRTAATLARSPIRIETLEEAVNAYGQALRAAIAKRTHGLDRVAVLLSGGVDSTLVARMIQNLGIPTTGYCVGTEGSFDVENARRAAETMGLPLRVAPLTEEVVASRLPSVIEAIELNGMVQVEAAIPMYLAAEMASADGHKVIFTGQAADELFGGYSWYRDVVRESGYAALHERLWDDIGKLYIDTLEREDRMTMAHGLEMRAPFLDRDVIQTAMQIDPELKIRPVDQLGKWVHRELALREGVPAFIANGDKVRAQDGSAIPSIIQALAEQHFDGRDVPDVSVMDYGSNYRYLDDAYGTPEMAAFLVEVTTQHDLHVFTGAGGIGDGHLRTA